ncbi:bacteriorhodopsin [Salinibacter ruber]|uniref:bacteriorhodopsin n=1 Tax=Salinibacter ruber TaxID=146919 RepID=UPI0020746F48|nr:bacteriorhodopsin [Salinibacter ruber]
MDPITIVYIIGTLGMLVGIPPALSLVGDEVGLDFDYLWAIPGIAALMYLLMTFDVGSVQFQGYHVPIPRYIDWALTTPLLVGYTAYIAGASRGMITGTALADFMMIVFGLGAVVFSSTAQWVFFGLSSACHLTLLALLYGPVRNSAFGEPPSHRRLARLLLNYVGLLWLAYPLVWLFGPGLQWVDAAGIAVIISYLDVTAKVPFVYFIYRARKNFVKVTGGEPETASGQGGAATVTSAA